MEINYRLATLDSMSGESIITSIKVLENIIDGYKQDVVELSIPSITDPLDSKTQSPYIDVFKLELISNEIIKLKKTLLKFKGNKTYPVISSKLDDLASLVDEKFYVNNKQIEAYEESLIEKIEDKPSENEDTTQIGIQKIEIEKEEDLNSLRHRLLSNGKKYNLLDGNEANDEDMNKYHESFQNEILNDLTDLSKTLKDSALKFSSKLFEDAKVVSDTEKNMIENSSFVGMVSGNLNSYLMDKSGNKISLFWVLKVSATLFLSFIAIVMLIKILPHM